MKALTGRARTTYRQWQHKCGCVLAHNGAGWYFHTRCPQHPPHLRRS